MVKEFYYKDTTHPDKLVCKVCGLHDGKSLHTVFHLCYNKVGLKICEMFDISKPTLYAYVRENY